MLGWQGYANGNVPSWNVADILQLVSTTCDKGYGKGQSNAQVELQKEILDTHFILGAKVRT